MQYVVGGDIGGTNMRFALISKDGKIVKKTRSETADNKEKIVEKVLRLIKNFSEDALLVSIGVGGVVNFPKGEVVYTPNFNFSDVPLKRLVQKRFNLPCIVDNDANLAAWGEKTYGIAKQMKNFVCITLGTGIGGGLVINGNIYRGAFSAAGEIGHTTIGYASDVKAFSLKADYENMASGSALAQLARKTLNKKRQSLIWELAKGDTKRITGKIVTAAARQGDGTAIKLLERQAEILAIGLANLANVVDPEAIIISGGMAADADLLLPKLKNSLYKRLFASDYRKPQVLIGKLGPDAGVLGAAALAFYPYG